jgi:hypothetical protein
MTEQSELVATPCISRHSGKCLESITSRAPVAWFKRVRTIPPEEGSSSGCGAFTPRVRDANISGASESVLQELKYILRGKGVPGEYARVRMVHSHSHAVGSPPGREDEVVFA